MSTDAQAPRRSHAPTQLARLLERAIPEPLLAIPPLLLAFGLLAVGPARFGADTWFGLAAGRDVARHGLPHSDRLTALTGGQQWQDQQWLAHLVSYGLARAGGLALLSIADTACLVAALCIAMLAARRLGGSPTWVAAFASILILIQVPSVARAQTYAMPLFAALIWLLARDARTPDRRIFLVIPLLVLWANLHGSVVLACVLLLIRCAVGAGWALRRHRPRELPRYAGLACVALLAPFASPYGFGLFGYYRATMTNGALRSIVGEWGPTTLDGWLGPLFFTFAALAIAAIALPQVRPRLFDCLCLIALILAGLAALRNVVWLPYAAVVLLPAGVTAWSPDSAERSRLRPLLAGIVVVGAIAVALLAATTSSSAPEDRWPTAEGTAIARAAAADPSLRVITEVDYADWLLWRHPELRGRIAFDIRFELLGSSGLEDVAAYEKTAGGKGAKAFAGYRLALWNRRGNAAVIRSLLAQRGTRVLARDDGVYAILRPA